MTRPPSTGPWWATLALSAALCAAGVGLPRPACAAARPVRGPAPDPRAARPTVRTVTPATLEKEYGIRIDRVAVTGSGGLVDLRFTVLEEAKARRLLRDASHPPTLVAEQSGQALEAPHHGGMRNVRVKKDAACFVLYPNARGAVRPGATVAVAFGEVRVRPVVAL